MAVDEAKTDMTPGLARVSSHTTAVSAPDGPRAAALTAAQAETREIERLVAGGDYRAAVGRCARAYAVPLGRLCMAFTGSQAESEELVQETLLAAYDGI